MAHVDTIVVGSSAGGVTALSELVALLPENFAATVLVAVHFPSEAVSVLPEILTRAGSLKALHAVSGEKPALGIIYIGPPGCSINLGPDLIRLGNEPKALARNLIDKLFTSAAESRGRRVASVVLSGLLYDGSAGSRMVSSCGGTTIAQDPDEAKFPDMPRHAIETGAIQHVLRIQEIGPYLIELAS